MGMQLNRLGINMLTKFLPRHPVILPILTGPLRGRRLCCQFKFRPHYLIGHYEKEVEKAISENLKPGQIAYDIGANIGYVSLLMARRVLSEDGGGQVFSFEPAPNAFKKLVTNVQLNQDLPIEPMQIALANSQGFAPFSFFEYDVVSRLGDHSAEYPDARTTIVRTERLEDLAKQFKLPPPDFIKIDVEGFELEVLKGMENLLKINRPALLIETHIVKENGTEIDMGDRVETFLNSLGYRCAFIQNAIPRQVLCIWAETYDERFQNIAVVKFREEMNNKTHSVLKEGE